MSKLFYLIPIAALLLATSCERELVIDITEFGSGDEVPLSLSASAEDGTKVTFTEAQNVRWEDSDHIAVFDGTAKRDFSVKAGSNTGTSALFSGTVAGSYSNLYTVYPYSAAGSLSGSNLTVTVPSGQTVSSVNLVDPSAIVSVGKVNTADMSVEFKQVCGLVSFVINSNDIYKVIIEGNNIAGTATVVSTTGVLSSVSSGSGQITVGYSGGGNFAPGKYYVAVLPGTSATYEFAVSFVHEDGVTHRKSVDSAVTIARKGRKAAGTVSIVNPKIRHIYNKVQLDAWGAAMGDGGGDEQYFTVYLDADIDYEAGTWPYTANDTHFNGNFKGQGHKIYNMKIESGTNTSFITGLYGTFSDVIFGSSDGSTWDGVSYIMHTGNAGAVEYVGLIGEMRANNDTYLIDVVNYAPVYVPAGKNTRAFIGGLVGHIPSDKTVTMTGCKNYGSVSNSSSWTGSETRMGGILGQCDGALIGTGLENHGGVTVANNVTNFVGGLCGDLGSGSRVYGCKNYGSITFTDSGSSLTYLGGCFGSVRGNPKTSITDCHNYAAITATRNAQHRFGGILGFFQSGSICVTGCVNHSGANLGVASSVALRSVLGGIGGACLNGSSSSMTVTIQDCTNEASVTNYGTASEIGGIVGMLDSEYAGAAHTFSVLNCDNQGAVSNAASDISFPNLKRELRIGGIIGSSDADSGLLSIVIRSCVNSGDVSTAGALSSYSGDTKYHVRVGGIAGLAWYDSLIDKCKNFGDVSCNAAGSDGNPTMFIGGIVGYFEARTSSRYQRITDCINAGDISSIRNVGTQYIGGILGSVNNKDSYSNYGTVDGSKNYGAVSATRQTNTMVGGVCGYAKHTVSNCSDFGNVTGGAWNGAILGDGNVSAIVTTGLKVGNGVNVTGAANVNTKYSNGNTTYSFNTTMTNEKRWFSGWSDAAITVTVVGQESYTGSTEVEESGTGGYLFAHTGHNVKDGYQDYYRLFYAISQDGLSWTELNGGASPMATYYGFPYITQDDNGIFWLIGVSNSTPRNPVVWSSTDCVTWTVARSIPASVFNLPAGYENDTNSYGAIKIFFDPVSRQFMLTWHAGETGKSDDAYWESMRTFYVLTSDFQTFTTAQKLFAFTGSDSNVAQIDANIHYYNGKYYALFKDERTRDTNITYYKRPRIAVSDYLTGPYGNPGGDIVGNSRREAPTLVKSPDDNYWYLYTEYYEGDGSEHYYELYRSTSLTASGWTKVTSFTPPAARTICRHGCVIPVDAATYRKLQAAY